MNKIKCQTCETCKFSQTHEIFDPCVASIKDKIERNFPNINTEQFYKYSITKCHFQGPPQVVDPVKDWCYKWEPLPENK